MTTPSTSKEMGRKTISEREKEKEKKSKRVPLKERWLLTRKTWKYMTDAGRNLIPAGAHNRHEDLPKIEEYFQQVCKSEPKFILWKRKSSYPGARGTSLRWRRSQKSGSNTKLKNFRSVDESIDETKAQTQNADIVLNILRDYLGIADNSRRTTTLLGANTSRPDDTDSPSAQRPPKGHQQQQQQQQQQNIPKKYLYSASTSYAATTPSSTTAATSSSSTLSSLEQQTKQVRDSQAQIAELLERLRSYSQSLPKPIVPPEHINTNILEDKTLLRRIYTELKKQQLHRILGKHPTRSPFSLPHSSSLSNLWHFRKDTTHHPNDLKTSTNLHLHGDTNISGNISSSLQQKFGSIPLICVKNPSCEKSFMTFGTQTDFIPLNELQQMSKDYEEIKKEKEQQQAASDKESEKSHTKSQRKSSIDNEDVSQSVSDTIKRYLRMARKKSVQDDHANRFKRVNYDRNLRNIKPKGEINPPGMDEDNNKATQTLDSWPLLLINYIRGIDNPKLLEDSHADWQESLQLRIKLKQDYDAQQQQKKSQQQDSQQHQDNNTKGSTSHSSEIFYSGTQFFANLWHNYNHHHHAHDSDANNSIKCSNNNSNNDNNNSNNISNCNNSNTATALSTLDIVVTDAGTGATFTTTNNCVFVSNIINYSDTINIITTTTTTTATTTTTISNINNNNDSNYKNINNNKTLAKHQPTDSSSGETMQKSKSSSNVGQFVSKKIWRSRSRSQTRTASPIKSEWTPQGNCTWTTSNGKNLVLSDIRLQDLTEVERKILHRVAVEKINQLNLGVSVTAPSEVSGSNTENTPKKRRPLLIKRKALTTSFFDTGKKGEDKGGGCSGGLVFGVSLEKCVNNDNRAQNTKSSTPTVSDRGSRNSITSLLGSSSKGGENTGSCESLPTVSATPSRHLSSSTAAEDRSISSVDYYQSASAEQISRSQTDVHRLSQDEDVLLATAPPMVSSSRNSSPQVPALVNACINHLEEFGMHTVGIFRVSTSKKRVRQLREDFDRGEILSLDPDISPHDVATILKEYLRDLPEPLLCRNLYKAFIKTQKIRNRRLQLEAISHLIQLLPVAHRDTLYVLLRFLAKIVRSSDDITSRDGTVLSVGNKMDSSNLATVFAPNILRYSSAGQGTTEQEVDEQIDVINVIRTMIDHYEELFKVPAELVDEIYTNMMDSYPQQLNYLCEKRDLFQRYETNSPPLSSSSSSQTPPSVPSSAFLPTNNATTTNNDSNTTIAGNTEQISRRIYSREEFLHENAIKNETNGNISKRRERSSKTKAQDNESELRTHRHDRLASLSSGDSGKIEKQQLQLFQQHSSSINVNENQKQQKQQQYQQSSQQQQQHPQQQIFGPLKSLSRRLSSPHVLQNTGVVTASLKIPVQMQSSNNGNNDEQQQKLTSTHSNHGYVGQLDLQDIPFIEDEGASSLGYNRNEPIKGVISLGTKAPQKNSSSPAISILLKRNNDQPTRKFSTDGVNVYPINVIDPSQQQQQSYHAEPKITPSITSIGGAVLKSKTADFERMVSSTSSTNQQKKRQSRVSGSTDEISRTTMKSSNENENASERTSRSSSHQGPIYKRQELISSAVKPKQNK